MNSQSRLWSFAEALVNLLIGAAVSLVSQYIIFPLVGIEGMTHSMHFQILGYFTVISVARSYIVRRWFNGPVHTFLSALRRRLNHED